MSATPPLPVGRSSSASPCTGVCRIDTRSGYCEGCLRTLDEIAVWGSLDPAQRRAVGAVLPGRRAALARPPET